MSELVRCHNGHETVHALWNCPVCTSELEGEHARYRGALEKIEHSCDGCGYCKEEGFTGNCNAFIAKQALEGEIIECAWCNDTRMRYRLITMTACALLTCDACIGDYV